MVDWALPFVRSLPMKCAQLLSTSRQCPLDREALQLANVRCYRPNYTVMSMVELARDPAREFQLQASQLQVDTCEAGCLGCGRGGNVYRGALPCPASWRPSHAVSYLECPLQHLQRW